MTAERIASVVRNLKNGAFVSTVKDGSTYLDETGLRRDTAWIKNEMVEWAARAGEVVVDAQTIYEGLVQRSDPVALYEDHPCVIPPWKRSSVCYVNEHGNVVVMVGEGARHDRWPPQWNTDGVDWDDVRWVMTTNVFIGGRGGGVAVPTFGPVVAFQYALTDDGTPLDIHWVDFMKRLEFMRKRSDVPPDEWEMALLVHLGTLNFMSARNVDIVEPTRSRPQQKRIARHGVRVHELRVFPTGRSSKTRGEGQPLTLASHGVRGHFAHYGACCAHHEPRGLLFGKLEGKFYVPQHVRGSKDVGEIKQEFVLLDDPEKGN